MTDLQAEMIVVSDIKLPEAFDPHVANVSIRTGSNNPTEKFDLRLSVNLGADIIQIKSGDQIIEARFSIRKAEVKFDFKNCTGVVVAEAAKDGWEVSETVTETAKTNRQASSTLSITGKAKTSMSNTTAVGSLGGAASLGYSASRRSDSSKTKSRDTLPYRVSGSDIVQICYLDGTDEPIEGRIIDEDISISVSPNKGNSVCAVLARLRVREHWVDIEEIRPVKMSKAMSERLQSIATGETPAEQRRRKLFKLLLADLVIKALQNESDTREATLAADAIVVREDSFEGPHRYQNTTAGSVEIQRYAVSDFLNSVPGSEIQVLAKYDVEETRRFDPLEYDDALMAAVAPTIRQASKYRFLSEAAEDLFCEVFNLSFEKEDGRISRAYIQGAMPVMSAAEIKSVAHSMGLKESWLSSRGLLLGGAQAHRVAKDLGFPYSYNTLMNRLGDRHMFIGGKRYVSLSDLYRISRRR